MRVLAEVLTRTMSVNNNSNIRSYFLYTNIVYIHFQEAESEDYDAPGYLLIFLHTVLFWWGG